MTLRWWCHVKRRIIYRLLRWRWVSLFWLPVPKKPEQTGVTRTRKVRIHAGFQRLFQCSSVFRGGGGSARFFASERSLWQVRRENTQSQTYLYISRTEQLYIVYVKKIFNTFSHLHPFLLFWHHKTLEHAHGNMRVFSPFFVPIPLRTSLFQNKTIPHRAPKGARCKDKKLTQRTWLIC